jgi:hypothetical protein
MLRTTLPVQRGNDTPENDLKHDQRCHHGQPDRFPEPRAFPSRIALTMLHTLSMLAMRCPTRSSAPWVDGRC